MLSSVYCAFSLPGLDRKQSFSKKKKNEKWILCQILSTLSEKDFLFKVIFINLTYYFSKENVDCLV